MMAGKRTRIQRSWQRQCQSFLRHSQLPRQQRSFATSAPTAGVRLSKWIEQHSHRSRNAAERMILSRQVGINGNIVTSPSILIQEGQKDHISVEGKLLTSKANNSEKMSTPRVWLAHKLKGQLVTDSDPRDRPTLTLPKYLTQQQHLKPVGRLDMNTEGLLVYTTCGNYARQLELPISNVHRIYRVRVHGHITDSKLAAMRSGLAIQGTRYKAMRVSTGSTKSRKSGTNQWLDITCTEGKNRQIRVVLKHLGCK